MNAESPQNSKQNLELINLATLQATNSIYKSQVRFCTLTATNTPKREKTEPFTRASKKRKIA